MASDFSKPVAADAYTAILPGIVQMFSDLARGLEPTLTGTSTNVPTGTVRWNAASNLWERYNGTSWAALASTYAISISGNAATATTAAACTGNAATASSVAWGNVTGAPTNLSAFTNGPGYITGITSANVTAALGFTPYNATNPSNYITSSGSISGSAGSAASLNAASTLPNGTVATTQAATDNSTNIATTAMVQSAGVGGNAQSWQNMTGSRANGTTYTNTTGKPIEVKVISNFNSLAAANYYFYVNGNLTDYKQVGQSAYGVGSQMTLGAIIPAGATYSANLAGGISTFWELR